MFIGLFLKFPVFIDFFFEGIIDIKPSVRPCCQYLEYK